MRVTRILDANGEVLRVSDFHSAVENEYKLTGGGLELKVVAPWSSGWRPVTWQEIEMHQMLQTPVATWMQQRRY